MAKNDDSATVARLLRRHGQTYAEEAGVRLRNEPGALYQLLVLATLLSARISAEVAVAAARELFAAGYRTPVKMLKASWQNRVDALGRGHYKRYDERTATMLGDEAQQLTDRWNGDLRRLREEAGGRPAQIKKLLTDFKGIGPAGADIFLREVQAVWPEVAPYVDARVRTGAERLGLPKTPAKLAELVPSRRDFARLTAALIRISRNSNAATAIRSP